MTLPTPRPIEEIGPVTLDRFNDQVRRACQPVVLRGLAADWPAVAAARRGDREAVDYLLSFTAHYLLFGLVVGASVACERAATSPSAAP